ncbi:UDP-glucose 4-epimerase GalE [Humisphaera borealis]|uniref:UDP-glucose 4-epimerase n=1 Tax=Humisphaera borealis TaxID=2807512 RepID=A0A7M2X2D6_9BACT|nr:UDP-glucose 4-epimerase GalE [Humisphaera borealis]QOV91834.1 UDP-glucose 4-epimerase GalE [Humisphaera borealis]
MNVLVAGGAGYIGSHTVKRLKEAGHNPVIYDNVGRGHREVIDILKVPAVIADLNDRPKLLAALRDHKIDTVMHFAAYAYVGESVDQPLMYYQNNVATTVNVLDTMKEAGVSRFVFSSTCATYGDPDSIPITEDEKQLPVSPYGRSKLMVEHVLKDLQVGWKDFKFAALRYFNACGCATDGTIGEDHDPETHLIPVILQAILGVKPGITVFGTDYPTKDGTNVRDYIHVDDLADAHILAMEKLDTLKTVFCNLGTGNGFSVKEIIATAEKVTGKKVPVTFGPRRAGDAIALYANPKRAKDLLGWEAKHKNPESIIQSAWNWFKDHPRGYGK